MLSQRRTVPHRNFYVEWASRAFRGALAAAGFRDRGEILRALILWAIAVLVLFRIDWRGWPIVGTIDPGVSDQIRLGLCAVAAILVVFALCLLWHLIVQPKRMYDEALNHIDEAEKVISEIGENEADRLFLSAAYEEGFQLYRANFDPNDPTTIACWKADMDAWVEKIRSHLKTRWSVSALHNFDDLGSVGGFHYRRDDHDLGLGDTDIKELKDENGFSVLCRYSAYLRSVDDIVRLGHHHLGDVPEILLRHDMRAEEK